MTESPDSILKAWSEKYRPTKITEVLYHNKILNILENYIKHDKLPHLLFYGPPGTGKTSSIIAFAKQYYKSDFDTMIMMLNASEERGIETVRNRIKQFVITKGFMEEETTPKFKLIILDEIDAMTEDAQAILRKIIENYVKNVRFCFICNYLKKINPAIQSRCILFRFNPIPKEIIYSHIENICIKENMKINKNGIELIINKSQGDMRKLMNILQSIYMHYSYNNDKDNIIDDNKIGRLLSSPTEKDIYEFINVVNNKELLYSYNYINDLILQKNISIIDFINQFYEVILSNISNNIKLFTDNKLIIILKNFSIINENLHFSNNENIALYAFVSAFYL